ncbi:MAG: hypothetical protein Q7T93_16530 [Methylobacterium sp.]|uniref:hypothetical protein n=1 Tax=Methylobacterium sp. TaxID=409 RepID=UPI002717EEC6|nr:hypothetical protein [Methylobacterium sp.]MDO9428424.1 hypothetical protein [Methylobacterium sp.]
MTIEKIEYRVRPVERCVVTRFVQEDGKTRVETKGEYASPEIGHEVGYALCKAEHDALGWEPGDERIQYPKREEMPASAA